MKKKTFFETRIRIKKQSKLREIITPKITSTSKQKREKHEKNETRIFKTRNRIEMQSNLGEIVAITQTPRKNGKKHRKTCFRNSNQNREAIKTRRYSRYHRQFNVKTFEKV